MSAQTAAFTQMRLFVRLHQQAEKAWDQERKADASAIWQLIGNLECEIYGFHVFGGAA